MIYHLLYYLFHHTSVHTPSVFLYTSTRMLLSAITTLCLTIFLGPWFIRKLYSLKIGQPIRSEDCPLLGQLHEKKKDTPTMGGILILVSILISAFLWMDLSNRFSWILFFVTITLGFTGGLDDYLKLKHKNSKGLPSKKKFCLQFAVAVIICIAIYGFGNHIFPSPIAKAPGAFLNPKQYFGSYFFPFVKEPIFVLSAGWLIVASLISIFVLTGTSNAVNLSDGLDGLAAGLILMVSACLALVAFLMNHLDISRYLNILYVEGIGEVAIFLFGLMGACLGFLWYNGYPAQLFMGDIGSLSIGGILATSAILMRREFLLALVGGLFVVEALSVILQVLSFRMRNKKRIFLCAPIHHHFEYKGMNETKIVLRFWIIGLLLAIIGIASMKFQ